MQFYYVKINIYFTSSTSQWFNFEILSSARVYIALSVTLKACTFHVCLYDDALNQFFFEFVECENFNFFLNVSAPPASNFDLSADLPSESDNF